MRVSQQNESCLCTSIVFGSFLIKKRKKKLEKRKKKKENRKTRFLFLNFLFKGEKKKFRSNKSYFLSLFFSFFNYLNSKRLSYFIFSSLKKTPRHPHLFFLFLSFIFSQKKKKFKTWCNCSVV